MARPDRHPGRIAPLLAAAAVLAAASAPAEFHRFTDADGEVHVTNLPPEAYTPEGQLKPEYDPRSIVYQHRRLRERLGVAPPPAGAAPAEEAARTETERAVQELERLIEMGRRIAPLVQP